MDLGYVSSSPPLSMSPTPFSPYQTCDNRDIHHSFMTIDDLGSPGAHEECGVTPNRETYTLEADENLTDSALDEKNLEFEEDEPDCFPTSDSSFDSSSFDPSLSNPARYNQQWTSFNRKLLPSRKRTKKVKSNKENYNTVLLPTSPFGLSEEDLYNLLVEFLLNPDQMFQNGYPTLNAANQVQVYKTNFWNKQKKDQMYENCKLGPSAQKSCVRCKSKFSIADKEYYSKGECSYHWGKINQAHFTCCMKAPESVGCTISKYHVWGGLDSGMNGPLEGFVSTKDSKQKKKRTVYALDCEMCYTVEGMELCKVTVLGFDGRIVYDCFVKPENKVLDYNTRFSGVEEEDVNSPDSKTLKAVQNDILKFVTENSILIGHSLDNDLCVLKLLHGKIVDTAFVFPHQFGLPYRNSLKNLMWTHLQKKIQMSESGHDSYEDALSALQLVNFKINAHQNQIYGKLFRRKN